MMKTGTVGILATTVLVVSAAPALLGQRSGPDQNPAFRSGVEVVTVDVGVVDRQGQPLPGLTPSDFVVTVGGQPRQVVTAEFVNRHIGQPGAGGLPEGPVVSTNEGGGAGRLFAFVVDQNTLDVGSSRRVAAATGPFFSRLSFADRSGLLLMPLGPNLSFTWAHDRVREGLLRASGIGRSTVGWEYGSLSDAREIANRGQMGLRGLGDRECGALASGAGPGSGAPRGGSGSGGGGQPATGQPGGAGTGGSTGGTPGGTGPGQTGGGSTGGETAVGQRSGMGGSGFGSSACSRDIQMQAESAWRTAQMNSLASISTLRQVLAQLARVRGDKTVILISGGWPLDEREEMSVISTVAAEAAAARATLFSVFVPPQLFSADTRRITSTPLADNYIYSGPLENLASMTGGGSFRAEAGAEAVFERLGREMAGYYRIGIEKDRTDADGKGRRMKVQVLRSGLTVRAREIFDVRTYEDRDWAARLASAMEGPVPATEIGLRVTSYLSPYPHDPSQRRLLISGEISRIQPGEGTLKVLVSDTEGKKIASGDMPLAAAGGATRSFSTNIAVPQGSYIVRLGVIDSAGRVGSVDHRADVRDVPLGPLSATGPVLVRVPRSQDGEPRLLLDGAHQSERLALEVDLEGDRGRLETTAVEFEIAARVDGPVLLRTPAALSPGPRSNSMIAQAIADMRVLPPGNYVVRAKVSTGTESLGDLRRVFAVTEAPRMVMAENAPAAAVAPEAIARPSGRWMVPPAPFHVSQVLSPPVLGAFLERVGARPDVSSPALRELLDRARTRGLEGLPVDEVAATAGPVGPFLKGLTLLADNKLEAAAAAFRDAMRASSDFYPAMVYLGACYAAGGKDKEAAAAWRTALIREGDAPALHLLLADAQLRQGRGDLAAEDLEAARARWPEDEGLKRRYAVAAMQAGDQVGGLQALEELVERRAEDEPSLALGLLVLYEAIGSGQPIESADRDRARLLRFADAYRARGGPALALVDTWVAAVTAKE